MGAGKREFNGKWHVDMDADPKIDSTVVTITRKKSRGAREIVVVLDGTDAENFKEVFGTILKTHIKGGL